MIRLFSYAAGAILSMVLIISLFGTVKEAIVSPAEASVEHEYHLEPKELKLASDGALGKFDRAQLQRGLQVYTEVCAACHGINLVAFRDLAALGYNEGQIKTFAGSGNFWKIEVPSINPDTGEAATRKATPADRFPSPYLNETAARAANRNALPPDLSLITKAREGGAAYIYSLLIGYQAQPAELLKHFPTAKTPDGLYFNPYFANLNLAMPAPLTSEDQVSYGEGSPKPTVDQMAKDVSAFLVWTAEPKLENRHRTGIVVVVFLLFATILGYMSYKNIWAEAKRKVAPKGPLDPDNQARRNRARGKAGIEG
ncbi:MAG: cytochrome c1 [Sphingomonas bacterium]|nr:cytochrome c1 [Sphingomonas bacterium]